MTPIFFQFPIGIDPSSVPPDGGTVVRVFDVTSGTRVPARVEVSQLQVDDRNQRGVLGIWPLGRWEPGHQMVALVGEGLRATSGDPLPRIRRSPGGIDASLTSLVEARIAAFAERVDPSIPAADYVAATAFTVRSQTSVVELADDLAAIVRSADHPIRGVATQWSPIPGTVLVNGQVQITDFRNGDWVIPTDESPRPTPRWINFMMTVPTVGVPDTGAPVAIYGHGITVSKETMVTVAASNAAAGVATIGIDLPNHGSRQLEGGFILDLANSATLGRITSMLLQGALDHVSLIESITAHPAALDIGGRLDTGRVFYEGTSMGGFVGGTFIGLTSDVEAAFLQVTGSGVIDTISHSILWPAFRGTIPQGASTGEAHVLLAGAQMLLDPADNSFYLPRIRDRGTPVYLVYSVDDGVVPNPSSERMAMLLGLPQVGSPHRPMTAAAVVGSTPAMPVDGRGVQQVPTAYLDQTFLKPFLAHLAFVDPLPEAALDEWLVARRAAS